jgi:3-hydroxybutyryl-CoA dehydrogenase
MNIEVKPSPAGGTLLAEPPDIAHVGVIGAGQMGNGIAHVCALAGLDVTMLDVKANALERAVDTITHNMDRQVNRKLISEDDKLDALARIHTSMEYADLGAADLVIEAATDRPEKFIGMHFMNPVPVMKLVEIIRGIATDEPTFQAVLALGEKLGKSAAVAEDFPAFIVNRILVPMINEAVYALYEGVGSVSAIDVSMRLGANHPMGPLELADFIGLDTCLSIMQVLYEGLSDSKYRPCPLLVKYVEAGWLGRKSNRGFYDYTVTPPRPTR